MAAGWLFTLAPVFVPDTGPVRSLAIPVRDPFGVTCDVLPATAPTVAGLHGARVAPGVGADTLLLTVPEAGADGVDALPVGGEVGVVLLVAPPVAPVAAGGVPPAPDPVGVDGVTV